MSNFTLKKLYKTGAIFQIIFAVFFIVFAFPSFLNLGFGADILNWREFTEKVFNSGANLYIKSIMHAIVFVIFLFNIFALFVWRGLSNLFFKLSIAVAGFPLAIFSLNFVLACLNINSGMLYWFSNTMLYVFFGVAAALFVIGFVFLILESKKRKERATTYLVAKSFFWLVLALFNFVAFGALNTAWFGVLFAYFGLLFPYFLIWMLPILSIWQLVCGIKMK